MTTPTPTPTPARTGARTLWSFTSSDGEGEQQHLVACATCSRAYTVSPGRVAAQVADDDLACEVCGLGSDDHRPSKPATCRGCGAEVAAPIADGTARDRLARCPSCADEVNAPIGLAERLLLAELFSDDQVATLDALARRYTASASFLHLVVDPGGVRRYRPSLYCAPSYKSDEAQALRPLADAYDRFQIARGDERRVYRG